MSIDIRVFDNCPCAEAEALADLLFEVVSGGASVNFVHPFDRSDSLALWTDEFLPQVERGERLLLLAYIDGTVAGSAQLVLHQVPNQRHKADVAKVLVHPRFRRRGVARALMVELEAAARRHARTLLVLDTETGSPAEFLYRSLGFTSIGAIPNYCVDNTGTAFLSATFMFKPL